MEPSQNVCKTHYHNTKLMATRTVQTMTACLLETDLKMQSSNPI